MFSLLFGLFEYLFRKEELHILILGDVHGCFPTARSLYHRVYQLGHLRHMSALAFVLLLQAWTKPAKPHCWSG
jgi:hypothetical protein